MAHSLLHFLAKSIQRTARSRQRREWERCSVRGQQRRKFLPIGSYEHGHFGLGRSAGHRFETEVERKSKFQNAPLIDANKGRTVDMSGSGVLRLHQNGVSVTRGLEEGDQVFARGMLFPHAGR